MWSSIFFMYVYQNNRLQQIKCRTDVNPSIFIKPDIREMQNYKILPLFYFFEVFIKMSFMLVSMSLFLSEYIFLKFFVLIYNMVTYINKSSFDILIFKSVRSTETKEFDNFCYKVTLPCFWFARNCALKIFLLLTNGLVSS